MRNLFSFTFFIFSSIVSMSPSWANDCSREQAIQAETEASTLADWDSVYKSFIRFAHCDDGAISEGYSETIGRLLATDWKSFGRLRALTKGNAKFQQFVIHHIDDTVPSVYLIQIVENAQLHCPADSRRLCELVYDAAK